MAHGRESVPSGGEFAVQCCYRRGGATASEGSGTCCGGPVSLLDRPFALVSLVRVQLQRPDSACSFSKGEPHALQDAQPWVTHATLAARLNGAPRRLAKRQSCSETPTRRRSEHNQLRLSHCALRCDGACAAWPRDGKDGLLPLPAEFKRRPDELTARRGHREEPDGVWGAAARRGAHPETARVRRVGTRRPWSARVRHRRDRASTHRACSMACHAGTSPSAT